QDSTERGRTSPDQWIEACELEQGVGGGDRGRESGRARVPHESRGLAARDSMGREIDGRSGQSDDEPARAVRRAVKALTRIRRQDRGTRRRREEQQRSEERRVGKE